MSVSPTQALARIPAFPPVAARVLGLLSGEEVAVAQLETLINRDPVLASEVLGRANSSLYCLGSRVRTVRHAIAILGLVNLKSAVSAAAMSRYLKAFTILDSLRAWWQHSLATALLAQALAPGHGLDGGRAYLAGLLHDIGPMALLVAFTADYERLLAAFAEDAEGATPERILEMEQSVLGIDRQSAGLYLAKKWRLPEEVLEVLNGAAPANGTVTLPLVVHSASKMADALGWSLPHSRKPAPVEEVLADMPEALRASVAGRWEDFRGMIARELAAAHPTHAATDGTRGSPEAPDAYEERPAGPEADPPPGSPGEQSRNRPLLVCLAVALALSLVFLLER